MEMWRVPHRAGSAKALGHHQANGAQGNCDTESRHRSNDRVPVGCARHRHEAPQEALRSQITSTSYCGSSPHRRHRRWSVGHVPCHDGPGRTHRDRRRLPHLDKGCGVAHWQVVGTRLADVSVNRDVEVRVPQGNPAVDFIAKAGSHPAMEFPEETPKQLDPSSCQQLDFIAPGPIPSAHGVSAQPKLPSNSISSSCRGGGGI